MVAVAVILAVAMAVTVAVKVAVAVAVAVAVILLLLLLLLPQQGAETGMVLAIKIAGEHIQLMGTVTSHGCSKSVLWSVPC